MTSLPLCYQSRGKNRVLFWEIKKWYTFKYQFHYKWNQNGCTQGLAMQVTNKDWLLVNNRAVEKKQSVSREYINRNLKRKITVSKMKVGWIRFLGISCLLSSSTAVSLSMWRAASRWAVRRREREREERGRRRQQKRAAIVCALSGRIPLYETYSSLETEGRQARRPSSTRAVVPEADKEISACVLHKGRQIGTE